ncbi:MAG: MOSC domain-containing protein [Dongiaceae bacterium]
MTAEIGKVSGLWRYPVQSLQGEAMPELDFTSQGAVGDRGYCVVDDTSEGGTAARPKWKKLIAWRARYLAEPRAGRDLPKVEIDFADGVRMISDDPRLDDAISERLGRSARLARTLAPGVIRPYKASPCHLLTSATLKALGEAYPQGRFDPARFRPNVVLDCGDRVGFLEQDWMQRSLTIGPVAMAVVEHCLRCALTTRPQGDLTMDPGILHAAQQHNENRVGVYAELIETGRIRMGDPVVLRD